MNFFPSLSTQMGYCMSAVDVKARNDALAKQIEDPNLLPFEIADKYYELGHYHKAFSWYHKAALKNNAYAQNRAGEMLQEGMGVQQDFGQAMIWYLEAHRKGNSVAANHIGMLYCEGLGVYRDFETGLKWYLIAAHVGYDIAQFNVGMHFEKGIGVKVDQLYALEWYERAAVQGHVGAQYAIIHLNNQGFFLSKREKKYYGSQQMVMEHNEKGTLDDRLKLAEKQLSDAKLEQLHIDVYINTLVEEIRVLKPKGDGESNLKKDSTSKLGEPIGKVGVDQAIKSVIKAANSSKNNA